MQAQNLSLYTPSTAGVVLKGHFFPERGHFGYQINGKEVDQMTVHTSLTLGLVEWPDIEIVQVNIFFIELSIKIVDDLYDTQDERRGLIHINGIYVW